MPQGKNQSCEKRKQATDSLPAVQAAIHKLASALGYARDVECDPWQFAVEIGRLNALGVPTGILRWLVMKGFAEHALEITRPSDALRKFRPGKNLAFTEKTRFIITDAGLLLVDGRPSNTKHAHFFAETKNILPRWDREARVLCVDGQIVKRYRVPSPNQEAVLAVFQEEGWPQFIHDPLSQVTEQPPKQRLRETIRGLNTNQKNALLRFRGDGTGERVCWEHVDGGQSRSAGTDRGLPRISTPPAPIPKGVE